MPFPPLYVFNFLRRTNTTVLCSLFQIKQSFFNVNINNRKMFNLLIEKEPSEENIPEEEAEEEEVEEQPDEQIVIFNSEIKECFDLFDTDKNDTFPIKYLGKALRCLGIFLTNFELEELTERLDDNGVVNFTQFQTYALEKLVECDPIDALKIAFQAFDPEKECMLPNDRFKRWMMTLGDPLTEKEVKDLVKLGDPGGKGFIAYDDLVMVLLS